MISTEKQEFIEGLLLEVRAAAENISDEKEREKTLSRLEKATVIALCKEGALDIFRDAIKKVSTHEIPYESMSARREIAESMARAGFFDEAFEVLAGIDDYYMREWTLVVFSGLLADAGDFDRAKKIMEDIRDGDYRARALADVAEKMAQAKHPDAAECVRIALEASESINDAFDLVWVLCKLSAASALAGDPGASTVFDKSLDTIHDICHTVKRAGAFRALATAMAQAGEPRTQEIIGIAIDSAKAVMDNDARAMALSWLAAAIINVDEKQARKLFADALKAADKIPEMESKKRTVRWIASSYADAGDFNTAMTLAMNIDTQFYRYEALRDISKAMAAAGKYKQSRIAALHIKDLVPLLEVIKALALI